MFNVMVRGAALLCCVATTTMAQQAQPVQIQGVEIEHKAVKGLAIGERVRIDDLSVADVLVDLELDRVTVLAHDAQLVLGTKEGMKVLPRPEVVLLSGVVAGDADSIAYLAISPYGTNGFVELDGELFSISTGPYAQGKELLDSLRSAKMGDLLSPQDGPPICGYTAGDLELEPMGPMDEFVPVATHRGTVCRIADIAIETDFEYTDRMFGGNTSASAAYAISLMGAVSEIFERDVNVRFSIPFLRVWEDNSDPYNTSDDALAQLRDEWNATMGGVDRTVVHYLTGRQNTGYGGVAYLAALCSTNYGYGLSSYLNGSFPYPLIDNNGGNWDVVVVAHELGHNFGSGHTHNYTPPIDNCGNGDCAGAFGGTLLSYCHTCSGGIANIVLALHPRVQDVIIGFMDSLACDLGGNGVTAVPDVAETFTGASVQIDALANDEGASCEGILVDSYDSVSSAGGTVTLLSGQGPGGRDLFEYTPAAGFDGADSFGYTIAGTGGSQSTTVSIDVRSLLAPVNRISPIGGLGVSYYVLSGPSVLPDFDLLTPYATDISTDVSYPSTSGNFMTSGRADDVGAVLEGYVWAFQDGLYIFSTESDDGSRLLIGNTVVVNNDGLHGMVKVSGTIALAAGWHPVRIEVFERGGDAGLIATVSGPSLGEMSLSGVMLSHESGEACSIADMNSDGVLDILDVFAFLDAYNALDLVADLTGDGTIDVLDVFAFLDSYNMGCP